LKNPSLWLSWSPSFLLSETSFFIRASLTFQFLPHPSPFPVLYFHSLWVLGCPRPQSSGLRSHLFFGGIVFARISSSPLSADAFYSMISSDLPQPWHPWTPGNCPTDNSICMSTRFPDHTWSTSSSQIVNHQTQS
jgi:hypothetical protein